MSTRKSPLGNTTGSSWNIRAGPHSPRRHPVPATIVSVGLKLKRYHYCVKNLSILPRPRRYFLFFFFRFLIKITIIAPKRFRPGDRLVLVAFVSYGFHTVVCFFFIDFFPFLWPGNFDDTILFLYIMLDIISLVTDAIL